MTLSRKIIIKDINENFEYPIFIGKKILHNLDGYFQKIIENRKVFIIYDDFFKSKENINNPLLKLKNIIKKSSLSVDDFSITGRDKNKKFLLLENLINKILEKKIERDSIIITFGGGVIGDLGGFAASIILRGIKLIQIPTTLLAQVDSSVGGKTGINTNYGKNLVGSFHQPKMVLIETSFLKSLPKRELFAGFAEVIKSSLIYDRKFFEYLNLNVDNIINLQDPFLENTIYKSCLIKAKIVSMDAQENGVRAILNLGHTFGHAFETLLNYDMKLIHGEAVSIGIMMAFRLSSKLGLCDKDEVKKVENLILKFRLPISIRKYKNTNLTANNVLNKLYSDKKVKNSKLTFVICDKIGNAFLKNDIDDNLILNFLKEEFDE